MKMLCLLVITANIALFLWEYREGAFDSVKDKPRKHVVASREPILLLHEVDKKSLIPTPDASLVPVTNELAQSNGEINKVDAIGYQPVINMSTTNTAETYLP